MKNHRIKLSSLRGIFSSRRRFSSRKIQRQGVRLLVTATLCLPLYGLAATDDTSEAVDIDLSRWVCKYCSFEQGFNAELELGLGYVSDNDFKFGEYNGLQDDGAFLVSHARARFRDENADYFDLQIRDLGLDSRSIIIEGGRQGRYQLFLDYREIPHYITDSTKTPYLGSGSDTLTLPSGWINAGSTAGMTNLRSSLQDIELKTKRKRLALGFAFIPARKWETAINLRHELREGQKRSAGSFFFNSAQLVEPVDYETNEVNLSLTYSTKKWQSKLSYLGSFFNNHDTALTWQNAYNPIVEGADSAQLALPPDNQLHQIQLLSAYRLSHGIRLSGNIAVGRMEQDEKLLATSLNPNFVLTLPRDSAKAEVDTTTANLNINAKVSKKLRLKARYRYNERDNKTPSAEFNWVSGDAFAPLPRRNLPYSFTDQTINLRGDYRISRQAKLSMGYEHEKKERSNQEVDETTEDSFWGKVIVRAGNSINFSIKASHAERDASGYNLVVETDPSQNPLLRKYNMADRDRNTGRISLGFNPHERVNIELSADRSRDDYTNSALGLTESSEVAYYADTSITLTPVSNLHAFASREQIESDQAGSEAFANPDWFSTNDDTIDTFGLGMKHQLIKDTLDIGADYTLSHSTGKVNMETTVPSADFPDLVSELDTVKIYANYRLKENLSLHTAYWYEHYHSTDWMLDELRPETISKVLSFGQSTPNYTVHSVKASVRYRF